MINTSFIPKAPNIKNSPVPVLKQNKVGKTTITTVKTKPKGSCKALSLESAVERQMFEECVKRKAV
jgi:hypothetical protein